MQSCEAKRHQIFWKGEGKEREGICAFLCMITTQDKKDILSSLKTQELDIYTSVIIIKRAFFFMWTWGAGFLISQTTKRNYKKKDTLPNLFSFLSYFHILEFITHSIQDFPLSILCISRFAKASHAPQSECPGQLTCTSTNPLPGSVKWKAIHAAPGLGNPFLAA